MRIDHVYDLPKYSSRFVAEYGDLGDPINISSLMKKYKPDEVYNLAAQSHVRTSFDIPEYTANINALGTLRILESIRSFYPKKKIKFYQASTSEILEIQKFRKMREQNLSLLALMPSQNYFLIGQQ